MSQQQSENEILMFSDYVCPFCYLGRESLRRYRESRDQELKVEWHPYDLRAQKRGPDGEIDKSVDDGKDDEYYEQAKENVRRLQEKYDVKMDLDLATDIDSLDAQIASFYVKRNYPYETWLDFDQAIFDALWQDSRDIGDEVVITELAEEVGVDADEMRSALAGEEIRTEVQGMFQDAHNRGITGVPTFVFEGHAARGAVPPEQLKRLVEGV